MEITTKTRRIAEKVYPGLSARQLSSRVNDDMYVYYLEQLSGPALPFVTVPDVEPEPEDEPSRKVANRIADMAPAIDDQNWSKIERNVRAMQQIGSWDNKTELLLIARLNDAFDGAENEHRVQNSRITAFFDRRISV